LQPRHLPVCLVLLHVLEDAQQARHVCVLQVSDDALQQTAAATQQEARFVVSNSSGNASGIALGTSGYCSGLVPGVPSTC
jgi:hypothetical protein